MSEELTPLQVADRLELLALSGADSRYKDLIASAAEIARKYANGELRPVIHAHWVKRPWPHVGGELRCSHCNGIFGDVLWRQDYCPSCGAILDEPTN